MTENDRPGGSPDIAHGKGRVRQDRPHYGIEIGEVKRGEDQTGHSAIKKKVIPFQRRTNKGRKDSSSELVIAGLTCGVL